MRGLPVRIGVILGLALPASAAAQKQCEADGPSGAIRGQVLDQLAREPVGNAAVTVRGLPGCMTITDERGHFAFSRVPLGPAVLHVAFVGYRGADDSVIVPAGVPLDVTVRLQGSREPDAVALEPLPPTERMSALRVVVGYYREPGRDGEVAAVRETERVTGSQPTPGLAAPDFLLYVDSGTVSPADSAVLRADGTQVCRPPDLGACPGHGAVTFLRLWGPARTGVDTAFFRVDESVANPAACRRRKSFVGSSLGVVIVARGTAGWRVVESRPTFSTSGLCGPVRRTAR